MPQDTDGVRTRIARLRRAAERQGYTFRKNGRRDPHALHYGTVMLVRPHDTIAHTRPAPEGWITLAEAEAFLNGDG